MGILLLLFAVGGRRIVAVAMLLHPPPQGFDLEIGNKVSPYAFIFDAQRPAKPDTTRSVGGPPGIFMARNQEFIVQFKSVWERYYYFYYYYY